MKVIAVTGGIGSGKSVVSGVFGELGANVIDSDVVAHEIMEKGNAAYNETAEHFGHKILKGNGEIDRKALADIVFNDKAELSVLNEITHKHIYSEIKRRLTDCVNCVEIPLLFSAKCPLKIDLSVAVIADVDTRIKRITNRDGCSEDDALARIKNQLSDDEFRKMADCIIENNGDIEAVKQRVKEIFSSISDCGTERL